MVPFVLLLALIWGAIWALFLQLTRPGRFLAFRRTWITVVVGVGVDLLLALVVVPFAHWWPTALLVVISGLPIIVRSLYNEQIDEEERIDAIKAAAEKHDHLGP